jgi:3',5'-cyclic AMP phosphodiesterase CpdA
VTTSKLPVRIAQISDIHCGESSFDPDALSFAIERINAMEPDVVVVAGDLTAAGYQWEFEEAAEWLDKIEYPKWSPVTTTHATWATSTSNITSASASRVIGRSSNPSGPGGSAPPA